MRSMNCFLRMAAVGLLGGMIAPALAQDAESAPSNSEPAAQAERAAGQDAKAPVATPSAPTVDPAAPVHFKPAYEGLPEWLNWKCHPALGDINGDGFADLAAISRKGDGPKVWFADGKGGWIEKSEGLVNNLGSCGGGVIIIDVNRDSHPDLVVGDHCYGLYVFLGNSKGDWKMAASAIKPPVDPEMPKPKGPFMGPQQFSGCESIALGDINSDGHYDIVTGASLEGGFAVYLGDGTGENWTLRKTTLPDWGWTNRLVMADFNDDGKIDILAGRLMGPRVYLGDGAGDFQEIADGFPTPKIVGLYWGVRAADVNKDGLLDVVSCNLSDGPEVYLQERYEEEVVITQAATEGAENKDAEHVKKMVTKLRWKKQPDVMPEMLGGAVGVNVADFDGDGNIDLFVSGRLPRIKGLRHGVYLLRGNGMGDKWEYVANCGLPADGMAWNWGVAIGDINGDGVPDVAVGSGGDVAVDPRGQQEPIPPQRLVAWITERNPRVAAKPQP